MKRCHGCWVFQVLLKARFSLNLSGPYMDRALHNYPPFLLILNVGVILDHQMPCGTCLIFQTFLWVLPEDLAVLRSDQMKQFLISASVSSQMNLYLFSQKIILIICSSFC